jgi:hypothetical protein
MRFAVGYAATFPDVVAGVGVWYMATPRYGVFLDGKMTVPSLRDKDVYCPTALSPCTVAAVEAQRNDIVIRDEDEFIIVNLGGMYAITPEFMVLLGGGLARKRSVREYFDESDEPITPFGNYYVDHETEPSTELQLVGGMMIRAGNSLAFRFGYDTAPGGMSVGAYFILP